MFKKIGHIKQRKNSQAGSNITAIFRISLETF